MSPAVEALYARLRGFSPGDVVEAANLLEALERVIVLDDTDFDEAASLSRTLEDFDALVKAGGAADWAGFQARLPKARFAGRHEELAVDAEVLTSFVSEAREHLETVEARILSLESDPDPQTINEIFRALHTIKGVSGFLNLHDIKRLSHELEFLLEELRSHVRSVDRGLVDVLLMGCDSLNQLVHHVADRASLIKVDKGPVKLVLDSPPIDEVVATIAELRASSESAAIAPPIATAAVPPVVAAAPGPEVADLLRTPELLAKFALESLDTLEVVERCILAMERTRNTGDSLNEAFRSIHTLKGNAGFFGFGPLEALCMAMEAQLDALRRGQGPVNAEAVEALLGLLDRLKSNLQALGSQAPRSSAPESAGASSAVVVPAANRDLTPESPKADGEAAGRYALKKKDIRVDTEKLDALFDLIGELITAEAMVIDSPDLRGLDLDSFPRAAAYLSKITRELQAVTTAIRMIPLEGLFAKMLRLVRDLGHKFGKPVELEVSGGETEMDRNIIEEISDPLVHLIRNAIDHGIEDEASRRAKGKLGGGRVRLNARYEGNEIWITVSDDGAGLDRRRILEVARAKGLVGGGEPPDAEVWSLIFEPGFSTARQVSEISGRGVGMDVVKRNLEKLRGQIEIRSVADRGTDIVLKIPLTLAIIDGVTLRSGGTLYSLPIADVVEFQNLREDRLTPTDPDHAVLRLRDEVMPALALDAIFVPRARDESTTRTDRKVAIVVRSQQRKLALIVDEIVGYKQIVLKALPEALGDRAGLSGCSILGNGEVSLIIDVHAVFQRYLA